MDFRLFLLLTACSTSTSVPLDAGDLLDAPTDVTTDVTDASVDASVDSRPPLDVGIDVLMHTDASEFEFSCWSTVPPWVDPPPCSARTRECVDACGLDRGCASECQAMDRLCSNCVLFQYVLCFEKTCPMELEAWDCCLDEVGCSATDDCCERERRIALECEAESGCVDAWTDGYQAVCYRESDDL